MATARGEKHDLAGAGVEPGRVPTFVKRNRAIGGYDFEGLSAGANLMFGWL